jgi:hypothetical protein
MMMKTESTPPETNTSYTGALKLATAVVFASFFWCIVLPWYASQPAMKEHLQFLDDRGIDPSAMFYTELDAMDAILEKIENEK